MDINLYMSIIGGVTGVTGMIISFLGIRRNRYESIHEYLTQIDDKEFIETRRKVYSKDYNENCNISDEDAARVVNFFHHWGILAKKNYIPIWIFYGASGNGVCRLYEKTQPYIEARRKKDNDEQYGEYFGWLYKKLKKRKNRWFIRVLNKTSQLIHINK